MAWRGGGDEMSESQEGMIRCADCRFCKQFKEVNEATGRYVLKVRCTKGHWLRGRKLGDTDLFRVLTRRTPKCGDYQSMSEDDADRQRFLEQLARDLPLERIIYEPDGTPVDFTEVEAWDAGA
jgi:hypothetical protein